MISNDQKVQVSKRYEVCRRSTRGNISKEGDIFHTYFEETARSERQIKHVQAEQRCVLDVRANTRYNKHRGLW